MGPTRVLVLLLVAVIATDVQVQPALALRLPSTGKLSFHHFGRYESAPSRSHEASATSAKTPSTKPVDGSIDHIGRGLLQGRRRALPAPSWDRDGFPVPPSDDAGKLNHQRMVVPEARIAAIEARLQDVVTVRSAPLPHRRNRRDRSQAVARAAASEAQDGSAQAIVTPANICLNADGSVNYNMLSYNSRNFTYLESYPHNTIVKLEVIEYNRATGREGNRYWCTATALSDTILVTSAHCVKPGDDPEFPDVYTVAHYGFDGLRATAGTRVSKCIAFYDDLTQVDNAIIILRNSFKLPGYMPYGYINTLSPRRNASTWMLSYPADRVEMTCLWDLGIESPFYAGMVETRGVTPLLNYRTGRRCEKNDQYAIWATGTIIGGQSGGCLVHERTGTCIGTAAYTCELPSDCANDCPNAWGGFNAEFPLSALWESCGVPARRDPDSN